MACAHLDRALSRFALQFSRGSLQRARREHTRAPTGPWGRAVKVLTHDNYPFYTPRMHPGFTASDSPVLIFEGTYTMPFATKPAPTPRYDCNQILYRIDLDDPALKPAQGP